MNGQENATLWFTPGVIRYRVAMICLHKDRILLSRADQDDFWALPGGAIKPGETTSAALAREMREELAVAVQMERLLFVVENFFTYADEDCHEIGFYFLASLPARSHYLHLPYFTGREGDMTLYFQWFELHHLSEITLLPTFLASAILPLPSHPQHIIVS